MIALLALKPLAPLDEILILGFLRGLLLELSAAPFRLIDGVGEYLIRLEQLHHLFSRCSITTRGIECL